MGNFGLNIDKLNTGMGISFSDSSTVLGTTKTNASIFGVNIVNDEIQSNNEEKVVTAASLGYKKTSNPDIYYSDTQNSYFIWDETKNKFKKAKGIENILPNGNYKTDTGYFKKDGTLVAAYENGNLAPTKEAPEKLPDVMADYHGYSKTSINNVFFDKEKNCYVEWNQNSESFKKSRVDDAVEGGFYKSGEKYFDADGYEITAPYFYAQKYGYKKVFGTDIYKDSEGRECKWNDETKKFELTDRARLVENMKNNPADGEIGNFMQGTSDCWLLSSLNALGDNEKGREILKNSISTDENGNISVKLNGVNKIYVITKADMDAAIMDSKNYSVGDKDVLAIELAVKKFRIENYENDTMSMNPLDLNYVKAHYVGYELVGGDPKNAIELLTGSKATKISKSADDSTIFINSRETSGTFDENFLKKYFDNPKNIIVTTLMDENQSSDAHALRFNSYDDKNVYLTDPYDTAAGPIAMSKEEFYKRLIAVDVSDLSSPLED